jgi:hypothetical protein
MIAFIVSLHIPVAAIKLIVNVPAVLNVYCVFAEFENETPLFSQLYEGVPVEVEELVNVTVLPGFTL